MPDRVCECGCGQSTSIATRTDARLGYVKGMPVRFVAGHNGRAGKRTPPGQCQAPGCEKSGRNGGSKHCAMHASRLLRTGSLASPRPSLMDRFFKFVEQDGECWRWTGLISVDGYGRIGIDRVPRGAHRVAYELLRVEIPAGLHLDHLCRNRACVNPWHLEPVTNRVNVLRGASHVARQAAQTACVRGHEFTAENTVVDSRGHRGCRTCQNTKGSRRRAALREKKS
jgi:hypothetical protein